MHQRTAGGWVSLISLFLLTAYNNLYFCTSPCIFRAKLFCLKFPRSWTAAIFLQQRSIWHVSKQVLILCPGGDCSWPLLGFIMLINALPHKWWPVRESFYLITSLLPLMPSFSSTSLPHLYLKCESASHLICQAYSFQLIQHVLGHGHMYLDNKIWTQSHFTLKWKKRKKMI